MPERDNSNLPSDNLNSFSQDQIIGQIVDERYKILNYLGEGGMSTVYRAEHLLTRKIVALKVMHPHLLTDPNSIRRFQQEAQAASKLAHPHTISVYDMGVFGNGQPFLTMDYLEGIPLSDLVRRKRSRPSIDRLLHIFIQTADALNDAHERGIVHRDLKPSNIMLITHLEDQDFVKVVDFGIAKIMNIQGEGLKLTTTGEIFGSPLYMSPEQCQGNPVDKRSDIYSMGCLMYEGLTGKAPLEGMNVLDTMYKQINEMPSGLELDADPRLVQDLEQIVFRAMAKDPAKRFATMRDLQTALERVQTKSYSGSQTMAKASMTIANAGRSLSNKMGSSRKLLALSGVLIVLIAVSCSIAFATLIGTSAPVTKDRYIPYEDDAQNRLANSKTSDEVKEKSASLAQALSFLSDSEAVDAGEAFTKDKMAGMALMKKHRYGEAKKPLSDAVKYAHECKQDESSDLAETYSSLGYLGLLGYAEDERGRNECPRYCLKAAKIFRSIQLDTNEEAYELWATLGRYFESINDQQNALAAYVEYVVEWSYSHQDVKCSDPERSALNALRAADFLVRQNSNKDEIYTALNKIESVFPSNNRLLTAAEMSSQRKSLENFLTHRQAATNEMYQYALIHLKELGLNGAFNTGAVYNNLGLSKLAALSSMKDLDLSHSQLQAEYEDIANDFDNALKYIRQVRSEDDNAIAKVLYSKADLEWKRHDVQAALQDRLQARKAWGKVTPPPSASPHSEQNAQGK